MNKNIPLSRRSSSPAARRSIGAPLALAIAAALLAPAAQAVEFSIGDATANLDTTLSYGASWRMQEQDDDLIGKARFNPALVAQTCRCLPEGHQDLMFEPMVDFALAALRDGRFRDLPAEVTHPAATC